jgi:hypothetical protein
MCCFTVFSVCSCRLRFSSVQSSVRVERSLDVQLVMTVVLFVVVRLQCATGDDRCAVCCSAFAVHCAVRYSCHQSLRLMVVPFVAVLTRNCD